MIKVRKVYSLKRKKSILRNRVFWEFFFVVIAILALSYFLVFSNFFQVNNIKVVGYKKVDPKSVEEIVRRDINKKILSWTTKSIFTINHHNLEKEILGYFPQIENLRIKKRFPSSLVISINEREPVIYFCRKENCFLTDKNGIAFEKLSQSGNLLTVKDIFEQDKVIKLGDQVVNKEELSKILKVFSGLKGFKIKFAAIEDPHKLSFRDENGFDIYFDLGGDIKRQLFNLNTILEGKISPGERKNLEYIDLRFGNRVFWKYKESG